MLRLARLPFARSLGVFIILALLLVVPLLPARPTGARPPAQAYPGQAGVEMVRLWSHGGFPADPITMLPPAHWPYAFHADMPPLSFRYPPDWTPSLVSEWTWKSLRVTSPNGDAGFEHAFITGYPQATARQAAEMGVTTLLGRDTPVTLVVADDDWPIYGGLLYGSFLAGQSGPLLVASQGLAIPSSRGNYLLYRVMAGPAEQFDALTWQVFLPILYQFNPSQGGEATPTPEPWW